MSLLQRPIVNLGVRINPDATEKKEEKGGTLSPRKRTGETMPAMNVEDFVAHVESEYPKLVRGQ